MRLTAIGIGVAGLLLAGAGWLLVDRGFLGPPAVTMQEKHQAGRTSVSFDHSILDELLGKHVRPGGWVDYSSLRADADRLDRYIAAIGVADLDLLGRDEKLALLINAYNAFTLRLILDHYPDIDSIRDIPAGRRWKAKRWRVGSDVWSLDQIEHERIRPNFMEPRIHFVLVCAAVGCPPLRNEAYEGARIEEQLELQSKLVHENDRWFRFDADSGTVYLTKLYDWYGGDFEQTAGSVPRFASRYSPALAAAIEEGRHPSIRWIPYDWTLNDVGKRPSRADDRGNAAPAER